jgi:hypothetical protein
MFFSEEKNQKTFIRLPMSPAVKHTQTHRHCERSEAIQPFVPAATRIGREPTPAKPTRTHSHP